MKLYPEALEDFNKAIQMQPDWALYYCYRAKLLILMGKKKEALDDLNATYKLSKDLVETSTFTKGNI